MVAAGGGCGWAEQLHPRTSRLTLLLDAGWMESASGTACPGRAFSKFPPSGPPSTAGGQRSVAVSTVGRAYELHRDDNDVENTMESLGVQTRRVLYVDPATHPLTGGRFGPLRPEWTRARSGPGVASPSLTPKDVELRGSKKQREDVLFYVWV